MLLNTFKLSMTLIRKLIAKQRDKAWDATKQEDGEDQQWWLTIYVIEWWWKTREYGIKMC